MAKRLILQNLPSNVKQGACGLCIDAARKRVWTVQCAAFTGDVCDQHMEILVRNGKPKEEAPEATLFDAKAS